MVVIPITLVALFLLYWIGQFVFFMSLEDSLFPGRYDKVLWAVGFFICPILVPPAFHLWRNTRERARRRDLPTPTFNPGPTA